MKILRIFDVSGYIHVGAVNKRAFLLPPISTDVDGFRERKIYCGGASLLWNVLYYEYGKCDMAFCCDRRPTIKQDMYEHYKMHRIHSDFISRSKKATEYILEDCGLHTLSAEGYEADDFIYSLVRDLKNDYDHIYVYTGDSDQYFLVAENVSIEPSSSRAKHVDIQNYTYTVGKSFTPYNTSTFEKILFGDKSDGIPGLPQELAWRLKDVCNQPLYQKLLGDKETVMHILAQFGPEAVAQGELVFPLDVRVPTTFNQGDKLRIAEWGNAFHNSFWKTGQRPSQHILDCIKEMDEEGMSSETSNR